MTAQLINPRLWAGLIVAAAIAYALHWIYQAGGAAADARLANYQATSQEAGLKESETQRAKEAAYQSAVKTLGESIVQARKNRIAADSMSAERVQHYATAAAAADRQGSTETATAARVDDAYRTIARECPPALEAMDRAFRERQDRINHLQSYIVKME
jgi:hypothetical protein